MSTSTWPVEPGNTRISAEYAQKSPPIVGKNRQLVTDEPVEFEK